MTTIRPFLVAPFILAFGLMIIAGVVQPGATVAVATLAFLSIAVGWAMVLYVKAPRQTAMLFTIVDCVALLVALAI